MWTLANGEAKHGAIMFMDTEHRQEHRQLIQLNRSKINYEVIFFMVEKIIVNPTKTRAYGNIIGAKDSTDYDTYKAYITEITDTVYGSTSNVFSMECEPHIGLTATNPYILSGETTDLVVSLVNAFGSPLSGKTVTLSDGTSVYTGITDNNGQYTETGVTVSSDTLFTASYKNVSDVCNVEYCLFKDYAVTGKSNYTAFYNYNIFNPQVSDTGTLLTNNVASTYNYFANLDSTSDLYDFTAPFTVDFDIVSFSGTTIGTQIGESGQSGAVRTFSQLGITQPCHLKLIVTGTQIIYQVDNETVMTQNYTVTQGRVSTILNSGTLKYKNFRIRPL